jgi:hemin uptake protein HemP
MNGADRPNDVGPGTGEAGAPSSAPAPAAPAPGGRAIASETLFAGASDVHISHRGSLYRLKQTALGKLILTK